VRVALDIRYRVESGASTYIQALLPCLVEAAPAGTDFLYIRYDRQSLDGLPEAPAVECPRHGALRELAWLNRTLPRELTEHRVDLYHGMKLFGPVWSPVPMVHTAHSISLPRKGEFPMSPKQRAINAYGNLLLKRSCRVICVSRYVSDFMADELGIPPDRLRTIGLAVSEAVRDALAKADPSLFDTPGLDGAAYAVCVGNIEYVKNHATAVRALGIIRDRVPHHLVIAGRDDKPAAEELRDLIRSEGLEDRVHLTGFMGFPTLASCLLGAELLVHPSLSEGFCLAVLEGMQAGLPVIGSAIPGIEEVVGETGRTVADPRDHRALAEAMLDWLAHPEEARRRAALGKVRAEQLTWDRVASETLAVYDECLERHDAPRPVDTSVAR
jgi:glycosyltransferase involved in cell wall biosynthesis